MDELKVPDEWKSLWLAGAGKPDVDALVAGVLKEAGKYRERTLRFHDVMMVLTAILILPLVALGGGGLALFGRLVLAATLIVNLAGYWRFHRGMGDAPAPGAPSCDYVTHYLEYQDRLAGLLGWTFRHGSFLPVVAGALFIAGAWWDGDLLGIPVGVSCCLAWLAGRWMTRYELKRIEGRQARLRALLEGMGEPERPGSHRLS
jgi:hypothetical protein